MGQPESTTSIQNHAMRSRRPLSLGLTAALRSPSASARMAAQAASSRHRIKRPSVVIFESLELPAGSEMVRASEMAERISSETAGRTCYAIHLDHRD